MKGSKVWGGRIGFVLVMGLSASAWADEAPNTQAPVAPTLSRKAQADALYDEGMEAAALKRWEAAAEAFKKSDELEPSINTIAQWGRVLVLDDKYVEGATKLQRFLREAKDAPEGLTKGVQGLLRDAKRKVATVQVKIEPADAVLIIDDIKIDADEASGPMYLEPRAHTFTAEKKGFVMTPVSRTYAAGADVTVDLKMEVAQEGAVDPNGPVGPVGPGPKEEAGSGMSLPVKIGFGVAGGVGVAGVGFAIASAISLGKFRTAYEQNPCDDACNIAVKNRGSTLKGLSYAWVGLLSGAAVISVVTGIVHSRRHHTDAAGEVKQTTEISLEFVPGGGAIGLRGVW